MAADEETFGLIPLLPFHQVRSALAMIQAVTHDSKTGVLTEVGSFLNSLSESLFSSS